jgi:hypothetical protein
MRTLLVAVLLTGCYPPTAVPTAMHPTAMATEESVGVAVGASYVKQEDTSLVDIPHAEGWIRKPAGNGQFGLHVAPNVVHAGYRYDIIPIDDGLGVALEPMIGASYFRYHTEPQDPLDNEERESALTIMFGLVPTLLFPVGDNHAYVSLKGGFQQARDLEAMASQDATTNSYVLGISAGIGVAKNISVELGVHRLDDAEKEMGDDSPAAWLIVPTLGVRH